MEVREIKMDEQLKNNNVLIRYKSGNFTKHSLPEPRKVLDSLKKKGKFMVFGNLAFNKDEIEYVYIKLTKKEKK